MFIQTSLIGREVAIAALALQRKLIQDRGALDRRLGFSEMEADGALSVNAYNQGLFEGVPSTEAGTVPIDIPSTQSANGLRNALSLWGAAATKKDASVHQLTLSTDVDERKSAAQAMSDQLSEQLSLPVIDITAAGAKPA